MGRYTSVCAKCVTRRCSFPERTSRYPDNCVRELNKSMVRETMEKSWTDPEIRRLNEACDRLSAEGYGEKGYKWTRIEEIIRYSRILGYNKLGLAFCSGLFDEAKTLQNILEENGFEVISVSCMAGAQTREELGLEQPKYIGTIVCNPIMQAEVLNREETDLNIMLGLCLGHDILFLRYSKADVTPLIVKDRVTGHNPVATLYTYDPYYKKRLSSVGE